MDCCGGKKGCCKPMKKKVSKKKKVTKKKKTTKKKK
jgi:hypothetical protein